MTSNIFGLRQLIIQHTGEWPQIRILSAMQQITRTMVRPNLSNSVICKFVSAPFFSILIIKPNMYCTERVKTNLAASKRIMSTVLPNFPMNGMLNPNCTQDWHRHTSNSPQHYQTSPTGRQESWSLHSRSYRRAQSRIPVLPNGHNHQRLIPRPNHRSRRHNRPQRRQRIPHGNHHPRERKHRRRRRANLPQRTRPPKPHQAIPIRAAEAAGVHRGSRAGLQPRGLQAERRRRHRRGLGHVPSCKTDGGR